MLIDTHCHTKYSYDNWLEPVDLIQRAKALGIDGICVTEHYSYEASAPVVAIARDEGILLIRGVEISTEKGHLLVFGVEDDSWNVWGRNTYLPMEPIIEYVNDIGGVAIPAHPYREMGLSSLLDRILELQGIAAVETHNGGNHGNDNELAMKAAEILQLPTLGGSDCHKAASVGRCVTEFFQPVTDAASFISAVRAGACRGGYHSAHPLNRAPDQRPATASV